MFCTQIVPMATFIAVSKFPEKHSTVLNVEDESSEKTFPFTKRPQMWDNVSNTVTHYVLTDLLSASREKEEDDYNLFSNKETPTYHFNSKMSSLPKNFSDDVLSSFTLSSESAEGYADVNDSVTLGVPEVLPLVNWWDVFDQQYLRHSMLWTITLMVAYMTILVIGVIGNCMVIVVVGFRPQMRTVTNMFIMNLAVADLFVIVFCVPVTLMANIFTPWILGSFMCKGVAYVQGVSVCASAYSLAAISLDRCKAIYRPLERPKGLSKTQALLTICCIWIVALLLTLPWAVIFNVITSDKNKLSYCIESWENEYHGKIYFLVVNLICCYSLPLILISVSNIVIWCHVSHRKVPQDSASVGPIKRMHRQTRHGVRKMLGIVTFTFLVSWLPLYILVTRVKFSKNMSDAEANLLAFLMPCAQWLGSWNSSINPVLYAFLNSKFREMFKSLLPHWLPCVHRNDPRILRNNVGRGTFTNGTFTAGSSPRTPSCTTVLTARSSMRSSTRSHNFYRGSSQYSGFRKSRDGHGSQRTLLVSSVRGRSPVTTVTALETTPPQYPIESGGSSPNCCSGAAVPASNLLVITSCHSATSLGLTTDL